VTRFTELGGAPLDLRGRDGETIELTNGMEIDVGPCHHDGCFYMAYSPNGWRWSGGENHVRSAFGAKELREVLESELEPCDPDDCEAGCWE
jgi:hypothetical protein